VFSADIVNGEVKTADIGGGEVGTSDIANDAVTGAKVADDGLGKEDLKGGSVRSSEVANNSLTSEDVANLDSFFASEYAAGSTCNDDDGTGEECASLTISIAKPSRLFVEATGEWTTFGFDDTEGDNAADDDADDPHSAGGGCEALLDGNAIGFPRFMGEAETAPGAAPVFSGANIYSLGDFGVNYLTDELSAGVYEVSLVCQENNGDIDFPYTELHVFAVGDAPAPTLSEGTAERRPRLSKKDAG